jgi:hypothetical protein
MPFFECSISDFSEKKTHGVAWRGKTRQDKARQGKAGNFSFCLRFTNFSDAVGWNQENHDRGRVTARTIHETMSGTATVLGSEYLKLHREQS